MKSVFIIVGFQDSRNVCYILSGIIQINSTSRFFEKANTHDTVTWQTDGNNLRELVF